MKGEVSLKICQNVRALHLDNPSVQGFTWRAQLEAYPGGIVWHDSHIGLYGSTPENLQTKYSAKIIMLALLTRGSSESWYRVVKNH